MTRQQQLALRESESRGDLNYINQVNAFIPEAERYANERMRKHKGLPYIVMPSPHQNGGDFHFDLWTKHYNKKMVELTAHLRSL